MAMERRAAPRHRVLRAGTILIGNDSINCMARDMSIAGAMLGVTSSVGIPEHFTLILSPDGRHMPCHIMWRKAKRIGVTFE
jgi:PilZ domain